MSHRKNNKLEGVKNQPKIDFFFKAQKNDDQVNKIFKMPVTPKRKNSPITQCDTKKIKIEVELTQSSTSQKISLSLKCFDKSTKENKNTELIEVPSDKENSDVEVLEKNNVDSRFEISEIKSELDTSVEAKSPEQIKILEQTRCTTPTNTQSTVTNENVCRSPFTPKKQSMRVATFLQSPRKFADYFELKAKVSEALEIMNYAKERSEGLHNFDLEKIYSSKKFNYSYYNLDATQVTKFNLRDVVVPKEKAAAHTFLIISEVFCNIINCEYFLKEELDVIYNYICLKAEAQSLFTRLVRRQRKFHRIKAIQRIDDDLKPFFKNLIKSKFLKTDLNHEDMKSLLNALLLPELKLLSGTFKLPKLSKEKQIEALMKMMSNKKSFFGGSSPADKVRKETAKVLGECVYIPEQIFSIFDRIFTLFSPTLYPEHPMSEIYNLMFELQTGNTKFYPVPSERFPVFRNREHIIQYIESKRIHMEAIEATEKKEWDAVISFGEQAFISLNNIMEHTILGSQQQYLPKHVQRFFPGHVWAKIVWLSIPALKKDKSRLKTAVKYLESLLHQRMYALKYTGKWFEEYALIKSHHQKDVDSSVDILINALTNYDLNEVDKATLIEKLKTLGKRKTGINLDSKIKIEDTLTNLRSSSPETLATITISGYKIPKYESKIGKSKWSIVGQNKDETAKIGGVEQVAADHYRKDGFKNSIHCEGALPVSLFTLLFWEELYRISIPGTFVSAYQDAPLDLFTAEFQLNRKKEIEEKLGKLEDCDHPTFIEMMTRNYEGYSGYRTIFQDIFESVSQFQTMIQCLGKHAILTICKKLVDNYRLWRSGFPDLIVWSDEKKLYKIVEVKGPNDTLSMKQRIWMFYLQQNGICTELCYVKGKFFYIYKLKASGTVIVQEPSKWYLKREEINFVSFFRKINSNNGRRLEC